MTCSTCLLWLEIVNSNRIEYYIPNHLEWRPYCGLDQKENFVNEKLITLQVQCTLVTGHWSSWTQEFTNSSPPSRTMTDHGPWHCETELVLEQFYNLIRFAWLLHLHSICRKVSNSKVAHFCWSINNLIKAWNLNKSIL